ncbi:hypothetical protein Kpol_1036p16 [Vanderwaltozyma polyspora DSM 70294]|uniref:25S rRNA adenine-N(1) methyltransferase n=1 Tax=Vanderwaltozyma polyspora (strain ATCC 22028 / DSM 70294 / BCRC 21397 / CBS 2163 / NBRC 10782 / NRRL Y-8283 / UCD 57-17) TaxID=436907 RepID=A7TEG7_VANPO|nr:uncharacterized protein Kpol_1036p16 [Vanderwaltozyma polyspora DSM 70294]EDO19274.1 hypothetical protein Kpol_1036p16 [Vanderwaltozyma polyspora DSM 70294]
MLSKKKRTITGRKVVNSTVSIKPSKARKIIRRFHVLISKRKILCDSLGIKLFDNDEVHNLKAIKDYLKNTPFQIKNYEKGEKLDSKNEEIEKMMLRSQTIKSRDEQMLVLGYIMNEIHERGGLKDYQLASRVGQDNNRGGDSSKKLIEWLKEIDVPMDRTMTALEIGSLSSKNYISTCGIFRNVVRIDLENNGDETGVEKQDFMERPVPSKEEDKFNLISCSLVLNFVPTPSQRGDMCVRFQDFLKKDKINNGKGSFIFIVLPLPCINNSRYMNKDNFIKLMNHLGYNILKEYEAKKIIYFLFEMKNQGTKYRNNHENNEFDHKIKLYDKPGMNNFTILLREPSCKRK